MPEITINLLGKELTLDEARALYKQLGEMFGERKLPSTTPTQPYPQKGGAIFDPYSTYPITMGHSDPYETAFEQALRLDDNNLPTWTTKYVKDSTVKTRAFNAKHNA